MSINDPWYKVYLFHKAFNLPIENAPKLLTEDRIEKRVSWMREEIQEFIDSKNIYEQADAMIDLIYFALGTLVEMGVEPSRVFDIVHEANMAKLFPDGKPHYNEHSKVIKPETWQDPDPLIRSEIDFQCDPLRRT